MKVDSPSLSPIPVDEGHQAQAVPPAEQASSSPALAQEPDALHRTQQPGEVVVSYHIEPGGQVYFQVIDEESGKVLRQVPLAEILSDEQRIDEFLKAQAKRHEAES